VCGVAGILDVQGRVESAASLADVAAAMSDTLHHRGPDAAGLWRDPTGKVALGHRRLAILDLTAAGHQPMTSSSGRYVLSYNGELYNFRQLRAELVATAGCIFRGGSDTEVLLAAIERWGVRGALRRANGMFAFALWDEEQRLLTLARDRLGEKPIYYAWTGSRLLFASELKALRACPTFDASVSRSALTLLLRYGYVPGPYSIYEDVWKLPPGSLLTVRADAPAGNGDPEAYWSLRDVALRGAADPFPGSADEAVEHLDDLLSMSVRGRLESDVPLGAFLSGGVDSSTVVALAQAASTTPIRTFTVVMDDPRLDEAAHAREVARYLGTDHHEIRCTAEDALALVPRLPQMYDEPFADPSQLPTALISAMARQQVTVCLSGDGGDEVFAGYNRYVLGRAAWRWMRRVSPRARSRAAGLLRAAEPDTWDSLGARLERLLPTVARQRSYGVKAHKLAGLLSATSEEALYVRLVSQWDVPAAVVPGAVEPPTLGTDPAAWPRLPDTTARMAFVDGVTTLPDDMLVKVDRASMAVSLETRLPLLDPAVVEFAWRLPMEAKIRAGRGKWVLREVLHRHVPAELVDRPKTGFDPPLGAWLRGPLRDWAEDLLDARRLTDDGFLDARTVRERWAEHLSGRRNHDYALWAVLMFQANRCLTVEGLTHG
jgi:asparagine synthase (glutamine-hydrolysing)